MKYTRSPRIMQQALPWIVFVSCIIMQCCRGDDLQKQKKLVTSSSKRPAGAISAEKSPTQPNRFTSEGNVRKLEFDFTKKKVREPKTPRILQVLSRSPKSVAEPKGGAAPARRQQHVRSLDDITFRSVEAEPGKKSSSKINHGFGDELFQVDNELVAEIEYLVKQLEEKDQKMRENAREFQRLRKKIEEMDHNITSTVTENQLLKHKLNQVDLRYSRKPLVLQTSRNHSFSNNDTTSKILQHQMNIRKYAIAEKYKSDIQKYTSAQQRDISFYKQMLEDRSKQLMADQLEVEHLLDELENTTDVTEMKERLETQLQQVNKRQVGGACKEEECAKLRSDLASCNTSLQQRNIESNQTQINLETCESNLLEARNMWASCSHSLHELETNLTACGPQGDCQRKLDQCLEDCASLSQIVQHVAPSSFEDCMTQLEAGTATVELCRSTCPNKLAPSLPLTELASGSYYFSTEKLNWWGAENFCRAAGMSLASVDSPQEAELVKHCIQEKLDAAGEQYELFWLGVNNLAAGSQYVFTSSGRPVSGFSDWCDSGAGQLQVPSKPRCGAYGRSRSGLCWLAKCCQRKARFVCKAPPCCSD